MKRYKHDKKEHKRQQEEKNKNDYDCSTTYDSQKKYQIKRYRYLKNYKFSTNPVVRERSSKIIQHWWRKNIKSKLDLQRKVILIQKVYRGYFIRKYIKDIVYLTAIYDIFCYKVNSVMSHAVRRIYFPKPTLKQRNIMKKIFNIKKYQYFRKWRVINAIEGDRNVSSLQMVNFRNKTRKNLQLLKSYFDIWKLHVDSEKIREQDNESNENKERKRKGVEQLIKGSYIKANRTGLNKVYNKLSKELNERNKNNKVKQLIKIYNKQYKEGNLREYFMMWLKGTNALKYKELQDKLRNNTLKHRVLKNSNEDMKSRLTQLKGNMIKEMADKIRRHEREILYPYGIKALRNYIRRKVFKDLFEPYATQYRNNKTLKHLKNTHHKEKQQEKYVSLSRYLLKWYYNTIIINKNNYTSLLKNLDKSNKLLQSYITKKYLAEAFDNILYSSISKEGRVAKTLRKYLNKNDISNIQRAFKIWKQKALDRSIRTLKGKYAYKTHRNIHNDRKKELLAKKFLYWRILSKLHKKIPAEIIEIASNHLNNVMVNPYLKEGLESIRKKSNCIAKQRAASKMYSKYAKAKGDLLKDAFNKWKTASEKIEVKNIRIKKKVFVTKMCDNTKNKLLQKYFEQWKKYSQRMPIILNNINEGSSFLKHYLYMINDDSFDMIKNHLNQNYVTNYLRKNLLHAIRSKEMKDLSKYFNHWKNLISKLELLELKRKIHLSKLTKDKEQNNKENIEKYFNIWRDKAVTYNKKFICGYNTKNAMMNDKHFLLKGIVLKNCCIRQYYDKWRNVNEIENEKENTLNKLKSVVNHSNLKCKKLDTKDCFDYWKALINKLHHNDIRNLYIKSLLKHKNKDDIKSLLKEYFNKWKENCDIGKIDTDRLLHSNSHIKQLINALKKEPSRFILNKLKEYQKNKVLHQLMSDSPKIHDAQYKRYYFNKWKDYNDIVNKAYSALYSLANRNSNAKENKKIADEISNVLNGINQHKKDSAVKIGNYVKGIGRIKNQMKVLRRNILMMRNHNKNEIKNKLNLLRYLKHWKRQSDIDKLNENATKIQKAYKKSKRVINNKKKLPNAINDILSKHISNDFNDLVDRCNSYQGAVEKERIRKRKVSGIVKNKDRKITMNIKKYFDLWREHSIKDKESKAALILQKKYRQMLSKIKMNQLKNRNQFLLKTINHLSNDDNIVKEVAYQKWKKNSKKSYLDDMSKVIQKFIKNKLIEREINQQRENITKGCDLLKCYQDNKDKQEGLNRLKRNNKKQMLKSVFKKKIPEKAKNTLLKKYFDKLKRNTLIEPNLNASKIQKKIRQYIKRKKDNETLIKNKLLYSSINNKEQSNNALLKKYFNHWRKNTIYERLNSPVRKIQKQIRGYLLRKHLPNVKQEERTSTKKIIRIQRRQKGLAPIINKYSNELSKYFIKWKYLTLNDKVMRCFLIRAKHNFSDEDLLRCYYQQWKNNNKKEYLEEQSKVIQTFIKDKLKNYISNKRTNCLKSIANKRNNHNKENILRNALKKLYNNTVKKIDRDSVKDILSNIVKNIDLKYNNRNLYYYRKYRHQVQMDKNKENAIIISNFCYNRCKILIARSKYNKLSRGITKKNILKDINEIMKEQYKKVQYRNNRNISNRIYKLYIYKVLSKSFEHLMDNIKNISKRELMNKLHNIYNSKREGDEYSYQKSNIEYQSNLVFTSLKYKSQRKSKGQYKDNRLIILLPYLVSYLSKLKHKTLKYTFTNIAHNFLQKKFTILYKKYSLTCLHPLKRVLLSNLKYIDSKDKFYFFVRIHIIHKLSTFSKQIKHSLDLFYIIRLTLMHKKIARALFISKLIRNWNRYIKILKIKNWQLDELEKNFAETYERLADGLFGNKESNPGIHTQVENFMEKVNQ